MSAWKRVQLGEVAVMLKGGIDPQRTPQTTFAHYSIPAFDEGMRPVIEAGGAIKSQKTLIASPVVLVSKLNPRIPRVWHVDDDQPYQRICSTEFVPIAAKPERIDTWFLAYALRYSLTTGEITGSTSAATRSRERAKPADFLRLSLPLPTLTEQRRIVDLLSRAEGIVHLRHEAEKKAAELIPALFLDMFGDPATNPKGWPTRPLGELVTFMSGGTPSKAREDFWEGDLPWVSPKDMKRAAIADAIDHVNPKVLTETNMKLVPVGSLLIVVRGMILIHTVPVAISVAPLTINQDMKALVLKADVSSVYLLWLMRVSQLQLLNLVATAAHGTKKLETARLEGFQIPLPPLEAQVAFANLTAQVASIQTQQSAATAKAQTTFDALLSRVFTENRAQ